MVDQKQKNNLGLQDIPPLSLESVAELLKSSSGFLYSERKSPVKIKDEIARREKLKNADLEQDIELKSLTLRTLLCFLGVESFVIFLFAFLQATKLMSFALEEWSFRLLVIATITQIYLMLRVVVEYLFPRSK